MKENCYKCRGFAKWCHLPKGSYYCDKCVPRGCSCNLELKLGVKALVDKNGCIINNVEDYYQPLDDIGREYPCCEYLFSNCGFDLE